VSAAGGGPGDPAAAHLATRRACGLFDFSFMGLYELRGAMAQPFLRAVQARDPSRLAPGRIAYTLLLDEDGTVFIDATLWRIGPDTWWLFTGRPGDHAWLARRALGRDVQPQDLSGRFAVLALQGPRSGRVLADLVGDAAVLGLGYFAFQDAALGAIPARIGRLGYSGELGYEILVPVAESAAAWSMVREAGQRWGIREGSFAAADSLRIESGYVLFEREIKGGEHAAELGLERLMVGVPRPLAGPARRLVGLKIHDRPGIAGAWSHLPGAQATSECVSPVFGMAIALGFVPPHAAWPGTSVRLEDGRVAEVARLPFYDPAKRLPRAPPL
jgi:glycine cleavage system aminomethyltransferase T